MLVTLYLSNSQEKKKKEKHKQRLGYSNILSHTSPQNLNHTYINRKIAIPSIVKVGKALGVSEVIGIRLMPRRCLGILSVA
jgi:hypothetical protein